MRVIWKYTLKTTDQQVIYMPKDARCLCVQIQLEEPQLWAEVERENKAEPHTIQTKGTGQEFSEDPGNYIGSYQLSGGALVFHVYDSISGRKNSS